MEPAAIRALRLALPLGAIVIVAVGLAIALSAGSWTGWVIVAIGLIDFASIPFVLRAVGARRPASPGEQPTFDPTADPSYNPYAREE